jgi:hypothetical protein
MYNPDADRADLARPTFDEGATMPEIDISDELLTRLHTVADNDYEGASLADALDRLLREHQEYVMIEAAGEARENASGAPTAD